MFFTYFLLTSKRPEQGLEVCLFLERPQVVPSELKEVERWRPSQELTGPQLLQSFPSFFRSNGEPTPTTRIFCRTPLEPSQIPQSGYFRLDRSVSPFERYFSSQFFPLFFLKFQSFRPPQRVSWTPPCRPLLDFREIFPIFNLTNSPVNVPRTARLPSFADPLSLFRPRHRCSLRFLMQFNCAAKHDRSEFCLVLFLLSREKPTPALHLYAQ